MGRTRAAAEEVDVSMFQFGFRSNRIIEFLRAKERKTVAVVGDYGSGKTTLAHFVEEKAKKDRMPTLRFISVSCWGFENAGAAQQAVLTQVVQTLAETVDCFAIQGMPSEFVDAVSGTSDYLKSIFQFVANKDPDAQLARLSPILSALNARLVVIIEDTERPGPAFDLSTIEGLLSRFRDIPEVSFMILASLDAKIDFVRLCEHTELIPDLDPKMVIQFLNIVRDFCWKQFPQDIDPSKREALRALFALPRMEKYGFWELNLGKLINTPRKLKATVRRFSATWKYLHGEIDIDELLIASCLRICAPGAFSFLMRRNEEFSKLKREPPAKAEKPDPYLLRLRTEWEELKDQGFDLLAAASLIQVLDSGAQALFEHQAYRSTNSVQEFRSEHTTKYRDRILNERLTGVGITDQEVLGKIFRAKDNGDWKDVMVRAEESDEFREICDMFFNFLLGGKLTRKDLWRCVGAGFDLLRTKYGAVANRDTDMFTFLVKWGRRSSEDLGDFYEAMYRIFERCIPKSLQLGVGVFHFLIVFQSNRKTIEDYAGRAMNVFKNAFVPGRPDILIDACDGSRVWMLSEFLRYSESDAQNRPTAPDWNKWRWLGPVLYESLKKNFEKMAPQIAVALGLPLIGSELPAGFLINEQVLQGVFGDFAESVMRELARPLTPSAATSDQQGLDFSLTHSRALEWLNRRSA